LLVCNSCVGDLCVATACRGCSVTARTVYVRVCVFLFVWMGRVAASVEVVVTTVRVCVCVCLQLYNEEVLDLSDSARDPESRGRKSNIKIHEDASGSIYTTGVTSRLVASEDEVRSCTRMSGRRGCVRVRVCVWGDIQRNPL